MFDIGFTELLLIFVVTLLVVGPEKLPGVAKKMGRFFGQIKRTFNQVKHDVEQELEIEAVKAKLKENAMAEEARQLADEMSKTIDLEPQPKQKEDKDKDSHD
jgi:sec-independent protein translocase protein TatB